jgi:hypothetical protein
MIWRKSPLLDQSASGGFFIYIDGEVRKPTSDLPGIADDVTEAVS